MSILLIKSATSQSSSYPVVLMRLCVPLPDLIYILNCCENPGNRTLDLMIGNETVPDIRIIETCKFSLMDFTS